MIKGKILLTSFVFIAAISGTFALKTQKKILQQIPIYLTSDGSQLLGCYLIGEIPCGVATSNNTTYYYWIGSNPIPVPANTTFMTDAE